MSKKKTGIKCSICLLYKINPKEKNYWDLFYGLFNQSKTKKNFLSKLFDWRRNYISLKVGTCCHTCVKKMSKLSYDLENIEMSEDNLPKDKILVFFISPDKTNGYCLRVLDFLTITGIYPKNKQFREVMEMQIKKDKKKLRF